MFTCPSTRYYDCAGYFLQRNARLQSLRRKRSRRQRYALSYYLIPLVLDTTVQLPTQPGRILVPVAFTSHLLARKGIERAKRKRQDILSTQRITLFFGTQQRGADTGASPGAPRTVVLMDDDGREADFEEERGGEVDVELLSAVQQEGEEKEEEKGMSSFPEAPPGSDPSARSTAVVGVRCPGYRYRVESKHAEDADFNDMDHYPFAIHAKRYPIPAWSVSCADGDVRLHALKTLTSSGCTDVCNGTGPFPTPCNACYDLEYNTKLKGESTSNCVQHERAERVCG